MTARFEVVEALSAKALQDCINTLQKYYDVEVQGAYTWGTYNNCHCAVLKLTPKTTAYVWSPSDDISKKEDY